MAGINFIENEQYLPKLKFRNNMKKQDTAMELLLARIDKMQSNNIEVVKIYAKELLKVEKEQINNAYELGCRTAADDISSRI